jgi:hypothetical protein
MTDRKNEPKPPKKRKRQPSTSPQDSGDGTSDENRLDVDTDPAIERLRKEMEGTRMTFITLYPGLFGLGPTTISLSDGVLGSGPKRRTRKPRSSEKQKE